VSHDLNKVFDMKVMLSDDVLFQEIDDETVLLDLKSESYFGLDTTATRIWQLLQEDLSPEDIYQRLMTEFEVEPERLKTDLTEHLKRLEEAGLIQFIQSP
jgi:hypothetical protein